LYLSEQNESKDKSYYNVAGMGFKVINNKLHSVSVDDEGNVVPISNLNGVLNDFKVLLDVSDGTPTGTVVGGEFKENVDLATKYWDRIIKFDAAPIDYKNIQFKLFGIVPKSPNFKADQIGTPMVFGANIMELPKNYYKEFGEGSRYKESEDGTISTYRYVKTNGKTYILTWLPGKYSTSYIPNQPDVTPVDEVIELNIESPFVFDSTELTDIAKKEFNDFMQSIKTNYSNATGDVTVTSSSSIDGDPEGKVASGQKRKDYDMELSKKRAQTIVSTLKNNLPGIKLNFIPNGIGQTDQFAPNKKYPEVKDSNQTAPNRRLII
jgi:outer membrane protein OmpA-like peptidoglycan-associated protein